MLVNIWLSDWPNWLCKKVCQGENVFCSEPVPEDCVLCDVLPLEDPKLNPTEFLLSHPNCYRVQRLAIPHRERFQRPLDLAAVAHRQRDRQAVIFRD